MRNPLTLWLLGIIVLMLIGFTAIFMPIWFKEKHVTRVVLTIPDVMTFEYPLEKALPNEWAIGKKKQALSELLAKPKNLGPYVIVEQQVSVDVYSNEVKITTEPGDAAEAARQLDIINHAMTTVFGANQFIAPKAATLFNQDTLEKTRAANQESVRAIMVARLKSSGMNKVSAYAEGNNKVVLEIPGVKDSTGIIAILGTTASLEFYLIPKRITVDIGDNDLITAMDDGKLIPGGYAEVTKKVLDQSQKVLTGNDLEDFQFEYAQGRPAIGFKVKPEKAQYFGAFTSAHIYPNPNGDVLAIVMDHKFQMVPIIKATISDSGVIEGISPTRKPSAGCSC